MINCGGNFSYAMIDLFSRGQHALFKVKSIFKNGYPSVSTFLETFDHTVKPVLLYSSGIWGLFDVTSRITRSKNNVIFNVFQNSKIYKFNTQFNKYVLGVGKKASNWAVVGELGRYPLYVDIIISMIKYWIHLHDDTSSPILRAALDENYGMFQSDQHCWVTCIHIILKEL
jgi:hypothetical protein